MIYIVEAEQSKKLKIGYAKNEHTVQSILRDLQEHHWDDLSIAMIYDGGFNLCREMQKEFSSDAIRNGWFEPDQKILNYDMRALLMKTDPKKFNMQDVRVGESVSVRQADKMFYTRMYNEPYWSVEFYKDGQEPMIKFTRKI